MPSLAENRLEFGILSPFAPRKDGFLGANGDNMVNSATKRVNLRCGIMKLKSEGVLKVGLESPTYCRFHFTSFALGDPCLLARQVKEFYG